MAGLALLCSAPTASSPPPHLSIHLVFPLAFVAFTLGANSRLLMKFFEALPTKIWLTTKCSVCMSVYEHQNV